jgi:hypothetical protein
VIEGDPSSVRGDGVAGVTIEGFAIAPAHPAVFAG